MSKLYTEYLELLKKGGVVVETEKIDPINKDDVLIVVDFQNDFVPAEYANDGGRFGVADGQNATESTLNLINAFTKADSTIIATKDFHPIDHCSFTEKGGPFPPHCVQGTVGAQFYQPIKNALTKAVQDHKDVHVAYKGFMKDTDTFSVFGYDPQRAKDRITYKPESLLWTAGYELFSSNFEKDIDSHPDVFSLSDPTSVVSIVDDKDRAFICGLAFDYCVLDTAIGASICGLDTYIVMDATRAAHIPGVGSEGSGFLSTVASIQKKLQEYGIHIIFESALL